jgi:hypothetical protein
VLDRVRLLAHERRHPDAPWLTIEAVAFLEHRLACDGVGFEWGSGRSTVWLARRVRRLTSIEHDPTWFEKIRRRLEVQRKLMPLPSIVTSPAPNSQRLLA